MKNTSKKVGKKLYRVYYNRITKSFEIKDFDIQLVNDSGVYYFDQHGINTMYDSFYRIGEYTEHSVTAENYAKSRLLDYILELSHPNDTAFIISFIHKENAEEFIETHQDLLKLKDLSDYYDMIEPRFKRGSISQQLTFLNEDIRSIMNSKKYYKTDSIEDFLYSYIRDVIDNCKALAPKEDFLYNHIRDALELDNCESESEETEESNS